MKEKIRESYWLNQNNSPVCPYCSEKCEPPEYGYSDGDSSEVNCEHCEKTFHVETVVTTSFTTRGDCTKNGQMPHRLYKSEYSDHGPYVCQGCFLEFYEWTLPNGQYPTLKEGEFVIITRAELDKETA